MKKNFKPNTWLYPQPVLVIASYGADGTADGMVAAWGGIYDTNQVGFMLDHTHKTVANLLEKKAFTVSMATVSTMAEADYLGIVSGNRVPDKVARRTSCSEERVCRRAGAFGISFDLGVQSIQGDEGR